MKSKNSAPVLCALCAAVTCVLAPIAIPMPSGVPVTLATFAVLLSGVLLGPKWGTASQLLYVLIGFVGLPVFAGYTAGPAMAAGPTGGYLLGYLPMALIAGLCYQLLGKGAGARKKHVALAVASVVATAVLYVLGTAWFMVQTQMHLLESLLLCVVPFLPGDLAKIAAVTVLTPKLEKALAAAAPAREAQG